MVACAMDLAEFLSLVLLAFAIPLAVAFLVRYMGDPESSANILVAFAWGAVGAGASFFVELTVTGFEDLCVAAGGGSAGFDLRFILTAVLIAPLLNELVKGMGIWRGRPGMARRGQGLIYALAASFGFGAMEGAIHASPNFRIPASPPDALLIALPILLGAILHLAWVSPLGYGIAHKSAGGGRRAAGIVALYLGAVGLHAAFNFLRFTPTDPSIAGQFLPKTMAFWGYPLAIIAAALVLLVLAAWVWYKGR